MGGFNDFAREAWSSSVASDLPFLNKAGVELLFDEHRRGTADHGRMLYAIAMFSCWWTQQGATSSNRRKRESRSASVVA
jgi:asparagine synthase (glutamine-hydrolysing)